MRQIIIRIIKGALIGSGFIIPGVSGGTLAVVFGVYERLIKLFSNFKKSIRKDWSYFLPIGLGALLGLVVFSNAVSFLLGRYEAVILWFFVGCILGTLPSLWKAAGKKGRDKRSYFIMVLAFGLGLGLLKYGQGFVSSGLSPGFGAWMVCGMLIALGTLVPGLSSSNFIVYLGLYKAMADGFKNLDLSVILPIALGGVLTVAFFIKIIERIYTRHYTGFFHSILGIVGASTLMIVPTDYQGFGPGSFVASLVLAFLGIALSAWMTKLEDSVGDNNVQGI